MSAGHYFISSSIYSSTALRSSLAFFFSLAFATRTSRFFLVVSLLLSCQTFWRQALEQYLVSERLDSPIGLLHAGLWQMAYFFSFLVVVPCLSKYASCLHTSLQYFASLRLP